MAAPGAAPKDDPLGDSELKPTPLGDSRLEVEDSLVPDTDPNRPTG